MTVDWDISEKRWLKSEAESNAATFREFVELMTDCENQLMAIYNIPASVVKYCIVLYCL